MGDGELRRMRRTDEVTLDVLAQGHLIDRTYRLHDGAEEVFIQYFREKGMGKERGDAFLWHRDVGGVREWYLTIPAEVRESG